MIGTIKLKASYKMLTGVCFKAVLVHIPQKTVILKLSFLFDSTWHYFVQFYASGMPCSKGLPEFKCGPLFPALNKFQRSMFYR